MPEVLIRWVLWNGKTGSVRGSADSALSLLDIMAEGSKVRGVSVYETGPEGRATTKIGGLGHQDLKSLNGRL